MSFTEIPVEVLTGLVSAGVGFLMKIKATAMLNEQKRTELLIKREMTADQLANSAAKRSSPIARKILAYIIVGTFIGGLLLMGLLGVWFDKAQVSIINEIPQKSFLWGLLKWGSTTVVTVAHGFVLPPWSGHVVAVVVGFFFGTGAAKPAS